MKQKTLHGLKTQLWGLCRAITELRYPNRCFTCDRDISGAGRQLGHFIPSSVGGIGLRYNLDNLRWQCYNCNINKSGNWPAYMENLTKEIGQDKIDLLLILKNRVIHADRFWYEQKVQEYAIILENEQRPRRTPQRRPPSGEGGRESRVYQRAQNASQRSSPL